MSWVATITVGGALATTYLQNEAAQDSADAAQNAAFIQADGTYTANELQLKFLRDTQKRIAAATKTGLAAQNLGFDKAIWELKPSQGRYDAIQEYVDLLSQPNRIMDRPGVQFQYNQGIDALQAGFSRTSGGGLSGDIIASAQEYGQNFAATALDRELNRLEPMIGIQRDIANFYTQRGTASANLQQAGATGAGNVATQVIPGVASTMVQGTNALAQSQIAQANLNAANTANLTNVLADTTALFATNPNIFRFE